MGESSEISSKVDKKGQLSAWGFICGGIVVLVVLLGFSITRGADQIPLSTVWNSIFHFNAHNTHHLVVIDLRLPREIVSMLVGAALAVSGAMMQGVTRNPLADSGLTGLNAGSGFALSISFAFLPGMTYFQIMLISFLGAAVGVGLVYGISSMVPGGITPIRLVLAGATVSALLTALSQGISLYFKTSQNIMFWTMGSVSGVNWGQLKIVIPFVIIGLIGALLISRSVSLLSLGEEVALGLGVNANLIKLLAMIIVVILAGASVAIAGSIGFVGIIVPHIVRSVVGADYRLIIPASAVMGSILMVLADLVSRMINPPFETPIGAVVSLIGVPIFLYQARKQKGV